MTVSLLLLPLARSAAVEHTAQLFELIRARTGPQLVRRRTCTCTCPCMRITATRHILATPLRLAHRHESIPSPWIPSAYPVDDFGLALLLGRQMRGVRRERPPPLLLLLLETGVFLSAT